MRKKSLFKFWFSIFGVTVFIFINGLVHAQIENCDFYGTARIRGMDVTGSNNITVYDQSNQLLDSDLYYIGSGNYAIHVYGDPDDLENTPVTFKIDNETANVVGGSNIWNQIMADVLNIPCGRGELEESTAVGAAILASYGVGDYKDIVDAAENIAIMSKKWTPNPESAEKYQKLYATTKKLYSTIADTGIWEDLL